ncbi:methylated-DNA--[protein]-cysteine S-methyltransferase [Mesoterricola silvestris]|uniref:Methylated-DNA--[protein]-cysteine S-methyltransferase n=1 Tax=Mesoterricola silvestris TaxID=2927979 RepID=A0AA48KBI4_9BACT|nr:MGMT family protein [Mesoterricola silvestris]BDU74362.1 methylated-DNA--[protein]-cysteine S-methyltransferase [Mesoterricola silvestris]
MERFLDFPTALGVCRLRWTERGVRSLTFGVEHEPGDPPPPWVAEAVQALSAHLAGAEASLDGIPLDLEGLPPFRRRVMDVLRSTRPGQTLTYGAVALLAGSPGAARAVGQAVARNPLPILVPCHRVLASDGPGGFSLFGSLEAKARLLALEGVRLRHN